MKKTLYYETALSGLVPVRFIGYAKSPAHYVTGGVNVVVKVTRGTGTYKAGEVFHLPRWVIKVKAGRRDYQQLVRQAELPAVDKTQLINARF